MAARLWMMSIQGSVLIGVVLVLRMLMRRYPKKYSYMLWLLVLVRLLCPVFIESGASLQPDLQHYMSREGQDTGDGNPDMEKPPVVRPAVGMNAGLYALDGSGGYAGKDGSEEGEEGKRGGQGGGEKERVEIDLSAGKELLAGQEGESQPAQGAAGSSYAIREILKKAGWKELCFRAYFLGCLIAILLFGIQYLRLKRQMKTAVRVEKEVWLCEFIGSPFVLGVFRPSIFLPYGIPKEEEGYILRHERMHIRHQDPLLRLLGLAALCLHWWNPAVWLAIHKMHQDMEMYCDEAVLAEAKMEEKKEYSTALLHYSIRQSKMAAALTFGESNTEKRVRNIMKKKKKSVVIAGCFLLAGVLCAVLFLTVPKTRAEGENKQQSGSPSEDGITDKEENPKGDGDAERNDHAEGEGKTKEDGNTEGDSKTKEDGNTEGDSNAKDDNNAGADDKAEGNQNPAQDEWQLLEDFALAYPDENGMVESKIIPDMMQPGSEIYFVDDTHFIILSGGLYYDTQEKVEEYKKAWEKKLLEAEEKGYQRVGPYRPKAGDYINYTDRGYAHRIYEGYTLEQAQQRALWPESAQKFGIQVRRGEDVPWKGLTDIVEIKIQLQDEEEHQYTLSYQYDLEDAGYFEGKVLFADVNFDGKEDILIDLGQYGNQGIQYYACFLWSEEQKDYVWIPDFEKIPNPAPAGGEKQRILSCLREDAASYLYQSFAWNGLELVEEDGLYVTYSEESSIEPKEIAGWKQGEKTPLSDGAAVYAKWQEDLAYWSLDKEGNAEVIYSEGMWSPDSRKLEGAWKIAERAGTTPVYGLSEKEQEAMVGTEIVYRNRLHKQMEKDGIEYYISILPFEDTKEWMISYQRMDALCMQILSCKAESLTAEGFAESFRISLEELGVAWTEDMASYEITDAYHEPYGQHCFWIADDRMLIYRDGVFFLAEKE